MAVRHLTEGERLHRSIVRSGGLPERFGEGAKPVLRVLMINYEFPPIGGGTGTACSQMLRELAALPRIHVDLVTSSLATRPSVTSLTDNIELHQLPVTKQDLQHWRAGELLAWTRRAMAYAACLSQQRRYDLCHCWGGWPSGLVGYRLRRRMPYIVALRGSDVPGYNKRLRWLDPLLLKHVARRVWSQAARVVAVSCNLRDLALQTQPGAIIDVIPNGADVQRFTPGDNVPANRLLFVGRLIERKGVHILLEAFRQVRTALPDAELTIVGDGPERARLEALAGEFALSGVVFRGQLTGNDLPAIYRESAILVLPAIAEAMPNVVLEAMAAGLAIVTTPTGGSEVLRGNGIVVPHADTAALRDALVAYLTEPGLVKQHGCISRRLAEGMSWSAVASCCLALYREVITAQARPLVIPGREFELKAR